MKRREWLNKLYDSARRELEHQMLNKDEEEWAILMAVMVIASRELRCNPDETAS